MVNKSILDESAFSGGQTKLYKRPTSLKPGNVSRLFFYSEMTSIERLLNGLCVYHGMKNWFELRASNLLYDEGSSCILKLL